MTENIYPDSNLDEVIGTAVSNGVAAAAKQVFIGSETVGVLVPQGYNLETYRISDHEGRPRFREGNLTFTDVDSFQRYINRYKTEDTLGYVHEVGTLGAKRLLTNGFLIADYVLDDHPKNPDEPKARRAHKVSLTLQPTAAAKRWGAAIGVAMTQEVLTDLISDGIGEIVDPDGAELRDLISNLYAVRNTEAKSVIGRQGETTVEFAENIKLTAGTTNSMKVPEKILVTFEPFTSASGRPFVLDFRIKVKIQGTTVSFILTAPNADELLTDQVIGFRNDLTILTGIDPFSVA